MKDMKENLPEDHVGFNVIMPLIARLHEEK